MSNDITPGQNSEPSAPAYPGAPQPSGYAQAQGYPQAEGSPQAPGYPQAPTYGQAPYGGYPMAPKNNTLAIVALISAIASLTVLPFIGSIVAVITGHMSLNQLKFSGEGGRGMALAGVIIGWVGIAVMIIGIIAVIGIIAWAAQQSTTTY